MEGLLRSLWGVLGGIFRSCSLTSQKLPLCGNLSVPWSLRPRNCAAAVICGHGRCELPAILRVTQKSLAASDLVAAAEAKNPAISATEWLRARLRPPWSLRFCDVIFVMLRWKSVDGTHCGATSWKFASEPPELLRSCSSSPPCGAYGSSLS